jgi:hypothetical protein
VIGCDFEADIVPRLGRVLMIPRIGEMRNAAGQGVDDGALGECRSIFMDWALSLPLDADTAPALRHLLATYADGTPDHPMSGVLQDALATPKAPKRRGGRAARVPD